MATRQRTELPARLGVLLAFVVVAYLPSLDVPFVFDDVPNLLLNTRVQPDQLSELPMALDARGDRDRPIPMLSFAVNYYMGGLDPFGYHAVNLAIHALNALLVFAVVMALARAPKVPEAVGARAMQIAFAGALIWAVHPVNTQAVTYIVQRMTELAALFYLAAVWIFALWRLGRLRGRFAWPLIVLAYVAAVTSKANAATLPATLLLLDIAFFSRWSRIHAWLLGGVAALGVALIAVYAQHAFQYLLERPDHRDFSGIERVMTQGRVIWHYLSLLAWPAADRLHLDYDIAVSRSLLDPATTLAAWLALVAVSAYALVRLRSAPWPAFGWLFFLVALSVESSFIPLELVFEHRVYLPAALLIPCLVAPLYGRLAAARSAGLLGVAVLLVAAVLTWQTMERNRQWSDFGGFWVSDLERGASEGRVTINGANRYLRQGQPGKALALLARLEEPSYRALQQRGEALMALGRYDEAIATFKEVFEDRPTWTRTAYYVGVCLVELGRIEDAGEMLAQMQSMHSGSVYTPALEASIALAQDRPQDARQRLETALAGDRFHMAARIFLRMKLADAHLALDRPESAREQYRWVIEHDPQQWVAWAQLYRLLQAGGSEREAAAIRRFLEARGVAPEELL